MNVPRQILKDLRKGENITWLAAVLLSVIAIVLNGLGLMSNPLLNSVTLTMLVLLATGVLIVRYRIEEILRTSGEILRTSKVIDDGSTVQLLEEFPALLDDYLKKANEIWMLGISLRKTTYNHYDSFSDRVKNGLKIRGLLINPFSQNVKMDVVAQSFSRKDPPNMFAAEYNAILERYKLLRDDATHADNIQIGLLDFIPTVSLYIFPREKEGGIIFVQVYAYRAPVGSTPYFVVTQKQNPIWYEHLCEVYQVMWEDSIDFFTKPDY